MDVPIKEYVDSVIAQLKGYVEGLIAQYSESQEKAVQAALAAQKELTSSTFSSSEKAITKAEEAQKSYNQTHNDLSRKMDEQYKEMMPRSESLARHEANEHRYQELKDDFSTIRGEFKEDLSKMRIELMKEIGGLRESRSEGAGKQSVADPMLAEMRDDQKKLINALAGNTGEKAGKVSQQQLIQWVVMLILAAIAIVGFLKK